MRHRVIRHHCDSWTDPAAAFSLLYASAADCFWLDSGVHAVTGVSYMGVGSRTVVASVAEGTIRLEPHGAAIPGSIFDFLAGELAESELAEPGLVEPGLADLRLAEPGLAEPGLAEPWEPDVATLGFRLGWVGWLGYELRHQTMGTANAPEPGSRRTRQSRYPDAALLFADRILAFDHAAGTVTLLALGDDWTGELGQWRDATRAALDRASNRGAFSGGEKPIPPPVVAQSAQLFQPVAVPQPGAAFQPAEAFHRAEVQWQYSDAQYLTMIRECQTAIRAGDAYQLCLTTEARVDVHPDPVAAYLALRTASPSHHGGFLRIEGVALLSSSPEQFLSVSPDGAIESRPIKGTRRRGATATEDAGMLAELEASEKERAENLMIVDLMRNDIGRVSAIGSVSVPSLLVVESYAQVHQLVSTVRGRLADGLSGIDALVACFPAGSMTGAPKLSATAILDRLEQRPRGIYSGAFGYFGLDGAIDLAMVIRSIVLDAGGATIGTGGGITALSVPEEELEEVRLKAAALLAALGVRESALARGFNQFEGTSDRHAV